MDIRARKNGFGSHIHIAVMGYNRDGSINVATKLDVEKMPEGSILDPLLQIDVNQAQRLMDDLWECGIRPSEGSGSAGSLAATERHLADMKKIAFSLLERSRGMGGDAS